MKYQEVIDSLVAEIRRLEDEYGPADAFGVTHRLLHAAEDLKFAEKSRVRLATPIDLRNLGGWNEDRAFIVAAHSVPNAFGLEGGGLN